MQSNTFPNPTFAKKKQSDPQPTPTYAKPTMHLDNMSQSSVRERITQLRNDVINQETICPVQKLKEWIEGEQSDNDVDSVMDIKDKHNVNATSEHESEEEEESYDSMNKDAYGGRTIQNRTRSMPVSQVAQFQLPRWEPIRNSDKLHMWFWISKAACSAYENKKSQYRNQVTFYRFDKPSDLDEDQFSKTDQITVIISHPDGQGKLGNYVPQSYPQEKYVSPITFGVFRDKYMTPGQTLNYKQEQLLVCLTAFHRISHGLVNNTIERVITRLDDNKLRLNTQTSEACFNNSGSVLIKRPLNNSLHDVLVCWTKPATLKELTAANNQQSMIPDQVIQNIVKRFGLSVIHTNTQLRYMTLIVGSNDNFAHERVDLSILNRQFNDLLSFIEETYMSLYQWEAPHIVTNFKKLKLVGDTEKFRFIKDLFSLPRINIPFNIELFQIVTLESVSKNEYFGDMMCDNREDILHAAATSGYNGYVSIYIRHMQSGQMYQFENTPSYNQPWVAQKSFDDKDPIEKDLYYASLLIYNTELERLQEWDLKTPLTKFQIHSSQEIKDQFFNLTYAFTLQQLQFWKKYYDLTTMLRVHLCSFPTQTSSIKMDQYAANLNAQFYQPHYKNQLLALMNTNSMLASSNGFQAPFLARDNLTRKAQLSTAMNATEIYNKHLKKIEVLPFHYKFHWIQNFYMMSIPRYMPKQKTTTVNVCSFLPTEIRSEHPQKDFKSILSIFLHAGVIKKQPIRPDLNEEIEGPSAKRPKNEKQQ